MEPVNDPERRAVGAVAPVNFTVEPLLVVNVPELVNSVPDVPVRVNVDPPVVKVPAFVIKPAFTVPVVGAVKAAPVSIIN